jgi:hypothetical protein
LFPRSSPNRRGEESTQETEAKTIAAEKERRRGGEVVVGASEFGEIEAGGWRRTGREWVEENPSKTAERERERERRKTDKGEVGGGDEMM